MNAPPGSKTPKRLPRDFFARPTLLVARRLLGCRLCHRVGPDVLSGRIVEIEAYTDDEASHARGRKPTPRNTVMFGPAGHAYVYFTYGMHHCFNIVTEADGTPGAVLIRGLDGIAAANGPARLCRALAIDLRQNRSDLTTSPALWVESGRPTRHERVIQTTRIGIRTATTLPWRFYISSSPGVSKLDRSAERMAGQQ